MGRPGSSAAGPAETRRAPRRSFHSGRAVNTAGGCRARVLHEHAQQVHATCALEPKPSSSWHVDDMAFVSSKLNPVARLRELGHRDERPFNSRDLESQGAIKALCRAERRDLLAQVGQARAVRGAVPPSGALHGRFLNLPRQQPWRSNGILGPAVHDGLDRPPAGLRLIKAA